MALSTTIGDTILGQVLAAMPGGAIQARFSGHAVAAWRCTQQTQRGETQYGSTPGASAIIRVQASLLPAGVTISDGDTFQVYENGREWRDYRVNGLALTMGMYRFTQADKE